jgi:DNA-binding NarL/FixJ family response regulator
MKILIVTGTEDDDLLLDLLDRGIAGFSPKSSNGAVIEAVLRLVEAGGRYLPPRLADIAASQVDLRGALAPLLREPPMIYRLSPRQRDVMQLVSEGYSNKEIAKKLDLAPSTVKTHVSSVLAALGASNRTDAAIKARSL